MTDMARNCRGGRNENRRAWGPAVVVQRMREGLERNLGAETPDAWRLELGDAAEGGGVEVRVALQDRALVGRVEEVGRERDSHAVEDPEVFRGAEIELVHVLEPEGTHR